MNELSTTIRQECEDAIRAQHSEFERGARAWDVYTAINGSQYDPKKRKVFKEEERNPWQFDFTSAKVDTLAGTIVSELPDPEWNPTVGDPSILTEAILECYIQDKDLFNYSFQLLGTIRDGCVHGGWCELGVSNKYHPAGNISLEKCRVGYLVPDPYWIDDDDSNLMIMYKIGYYNAIRMKQIWKKSSDDINRAIYDLKNNVKMKPPDDIIDRQHKNENQVGEEWRVIEKHYLDIKYTSRLVGLRKGAERLSQKLAWIPFPVTENKEHLDSFAEENDIDWETVQELPFEQKIHKVQTVTDLSDDIILYDGLGKAQCNSLPFLHYTTSRTNGKDKGIAETIADLQEMFNERMSHVHELVAKASGGSELINQDLFRDAKQAQRFIKMANKPGHKELVDLDGVRNVREEIGPVQVNAAIFQQVSVIYNELLPLISRVSDTMSAMSNSEDTGVLFEKKYQMNKIANILFDKYAKQLINNLGEKYYYQWQHTYANSEREIKRRGGGKIILNRKTDFGIMNPVALTPRCRVVVNENFSSSTYQLRQRMQINEVIKNIPETDQLRLNEALGIYFRSIPLSDDDKARMEEVTQKNIMRANMQFMLDMSNMMTQMGNNKVLMMQAEQMLQRMQMPQMQQIGQGQQMPDQFAEYQELPQTSSPVPQMQVANEV